MATETVYRKLQRHLDRMPVGFPATESGVEIRILEKLFTPEDAALALELSAIPEPASVIHKRLAGMPADALARALDRMADKGIILRIPGPTGPLYGKMIFAIGFFERQISRLTPELVRDSEQYMKEAYGKAFHRTGTTQMRVVPVNRKIAVERAASTYDDIRAYVRASPGPFAKMKCICRHGRDMIGQTCRQTALRENCLTIAQAAVAMAQAGNATLISREEMLDLLDQADRDGLVLQAENTLNPLFVCCCCGCCCEVLNAAKLLPRPADFFSTSFRAEVDAAVCQSCGECEMRCQMNAISRTDGPATVDHARCIGCALCASTCPSGAMRLAAKPAHKEPPPDDTRGLYMRLFKERYGARGVAQLGARHLLGKKF
jgi:Pyruvate/2-oxoacid:ferredoxin oxidoreductase delta subunit